MPVWYQIGLVYENLKHPQKAAEMYEKIVARQKEVKTVTPSLNAVVEMAVWRKKNIDWEKAAKEATRIINEIQQPEEMSSTASDT
jgi:hypothetical protein